MVFEPTEKDRRFLEKFLERGLKDSIASILRRARCGKNFWNQRRKNQEWRDWFYAQVGNHDKLELVSIRDYVIQQIRDDREKDRRPDVALIRFLKEWLDPTITALELKVEHAQQHVTRRDMIVEIAGFIDQEGDGYCETCGNPLIPWKLWRRGLERGEEHLLEDQGHGNGEEFYEAEIRQIETEPERSGS